MASHMPRPARRMPWKPLAKLMHMLYVEAQPKITVERYLIEIAR
jgi:hypothetical protein